MSFGQCSSKLLVLAVLLSAAFVYRCPSISSANGLPIVSVDDVEPFVERAHLAAQAVQRQNAGLGVLLNERLRLATAAESATDVVRHIQEALDPVCLLQIGINPESRVKVAAGPAKLELVQDQWRYYLVKVVNEAGVTAPLRFTSEQAVNDSTGSSRDKWFEMETYNGDVLPHELSGDRVEYRVIRLRPGVVGKRSAIIAADVGQGTADIGFRNDVLITFVSTAAPKPAMPAAAELPLDPRRPQSDEDLRYWLENMVWHHGYDVADIQVATGLSTAMIESALHQFDIRDATKPSPADDKLRVLPYPGGKHPRIGFLEGAVRPQRETKASVFLPWDPSSYVVLDVPEAVWSNLGLTYLAHEHLPTIWDEHGEHLEQLEWTRGSNGSLECVRELPNGIVIGARLEPKKQSVRMEMWLTNGTSEVLSDLRVQNCVLLKFAKGFESQTNDNKVFWGPYAACRNSTGNRWVISAWDPIQRSWGNADCPCLHSDPQFPDCPPGETRRLSGWLSFYSGTNVHREMLRIERTGWRLQRSSADGSCSVQGIVLDAETSMPVPARVHVQSSTGDWYLVESDGGRAVHYDRNQPHMPDCPEVHTSLSADPFVVQLPPGKYTFRVERGKEYLPLIEDVEVSGQSVPLEFRLHRWINMADRGWYSGDTHVHRSLEELPTVMLAEDLNVAFPLTYWVTQSDTPATDANGDASLISDGLIVVDPTHVIYPVNTEYEIFSVGDRRHTLGAVLALNHQQPFDVDVPPVGQLADAAHHQGALLDLDKHSWPWSLMIVPVMDVDLFELSNNHVWQAGFGLKDWTMDKLPPFMDVDRTSEGFTETGWIDFGFQTYYMLLNCGFRMRVSAGTASGVHPVPLGFGRVYVHVPGEFDYDQWMEGLDQGRSFVSTGPMLQVTFNGRPPGHTFQVASDEAATLRIAGVVESKRPLDRIELIVNGRLYRVIEPSNNQGPSGAFVSDIDCLAEFDESSWVAVRCFETHPEGRVRFAHTNPVFVDIEGKPLRPRRAEIQYLIHRMEEEIALNHGVLDAEALNDYRRALAAYKELAETAR